MQSTLFQRKFYSLFLIVLIGIAGSVKGQTYTHPTTGLQSTYVGACPVTVCSGTFYDNGGAGGNYTANINSIERTFSASTAGQVLRATFTSFSMNDTYFLCTGPGNCCDYLQIFDGPSSASPMIYNNCTSSPGTVTSTGGSLTFRFTSDGSVQLAGWAATLSCVAGAGFATNTKSDCANAERIYVPTFYPNLSTGIGLVAEGCADCSLGETYSHWYKILIGGSGTFGFTIDPVVNTENFDFAVFGPSVTCASLGTPVRCSNAAVAGNGNTGLGNGAVDVSETIAGDQWVSMMNVTAGESYKILVDVGNSGNSGFNLTFSGTAVINGTLPIQLSAFTGIRQGPANFLQWKTANELSTKQYELERSTDGAVFEKVTTLASAGNGSHSYSYLDNTAPLIKCFYRLKMVGLDGDFTYSQVIMINPDTKGRILLYPSPASDMLYINNSGNKLVNTPVQLIDVTGRKIDMFPLQAGQQQLVVSHLSPGVYFLKFQNGTMERFLKN